MAYSDKVLDHYENPRNVGTLDKDDPHVGTGMVGAPACGDVMKLQIKVSDDGVIEDAKFKNLWLRICDRFKLACDRVAQR
jgi:nitrogen fixation protein NifU and related proteins